MSTESSSSLPLARQILDDEGQAILRLKDTLDENLDLAVSILLDMEQHGRLVVSGMGKAGIIGMKISATFASTGIPSYFLHPAEAVHGDLGRFTSKDVALILSNQGETQEVLAMLPSLKRMGCPTICMTSRADSTLAKHSDVLLLIGEQPETGPLGLAPTTSTTLMLALGDALAMSVLKKQNFTREQFAFYHPSGSLGRALMVVSDIMRSGKRFCQVAPEVKIRQVIHEISQTEGRPGAAVVVNSDRSLAGVFTDGDLRRCLEENGDFLDLPVSEKMGKNPKTVSDSVLVQDALRVLSENKIDQVIVINQQNQPVGLVDIQDVVSLQTR